MKRPVSLDSIVKSYKEIFSKHDVPRGSFDKKKKLLTTLNEIEVGPPVLNALFLPNDIELIKKCNKELDPKICKLKADALKILKDKKELMRMKRLKKIKNADYEKVALALIELILKLKDEGGNTTLYKEIRSSWIPLADHAGMWKLRYKLEDLTFSLEEPKEYQLIISLRKKANDAHQQLFKDIVDILSFKFDNEGLKKYQILFRKKNIYGVYEKMKRNSKNINHITDLFALRIIVNSEADCYKALEILHYLWPPFPSRLKDYIKDPKPNGYKSIHTTLHCIDKQTVEFQIRTEEMDQIAKFGTAGHAAYKKVIRAI